MTEILHLIGYSIVLGAPSIWCATTWIFPCENYLNREGLRFTSSLICGFAWICFGFYLINQ